MSALKSRINFLQETSKPITSLNPELAHNVMKHIFDFAERSQRVIDELTETFYFEDDSLKIKIGEVDFKNPVGIAAGLIKEPYGLKFWEALGPGFITIGGITREAQPGNKKPRIFRFDEDNAIVNGMGLPGPGVAKVIEMLEARKNTGMMPKVPLIANLCNSAITPENERCSEYTTLMRNLAPYASGFEINISCPNQCGVGEIQKEESKLYELLSDVVKTRNSLMTDNKKHLIFVKVAPNLDEQAISIIAGVCNNVGIDGITATNTSTNHNYRGKDGKGLIEKPDGSIILGGMSGKPLHQESLRTIREFRKKLYSTIPIIGCGGIGYSPLSDVIDTKKVGACGMEILSSIIQGPYGLGTIRAIKQNLKGADINGLLNP